LAEAYMAEGKNEQAIYTLDHCISKLPGTVIEYNYIANRFCEVYYQVGEIEKGNALAIELFEAHEDKLNYYLSFDSKHLKSITQELKFEFTIFDNIHSVAGAFIDETVKADMTVRYNALREVYVAQMGVLSAR
jgi:hypothetical protein